jgi:hypothetical protein
MVYAADTRDARFGFAGEMRVEDFLKKRRLYVTRLNMIRNSDGIGAPMLLGAHCNLILPDFQVIDPSKLGQPFYVEVKTKTEPGFSRNHQCYTHGIDTPNWYHYRRINLTSGLPVWLLILEDLSGELLGLQTHRTYPHHQCAANDQFPKGGVFWKRTQFILIAKLEARQPDLLDGNASE